jgi:hypothetical protein
MRTRFFAFILLALSLSAPAYAEPVQSTIGGVSIKLPEPAGFANPGTEFPAAMTMLEAATPPTNRVLTVFIPEVNLKSLRAGQELEMKRYFAVQSVRALEQTTLSQKDVEEFKGVLKNSQRELMNQMNKMKDSAVADAEKKLSTALDDPTLTLKIGEILPRGVFNETPNSVSLAMLTRFSSIASGKPEDQLVAVVVTYVLVKNKLVLLGAYSQYTSQADIDWLVNASKLWAAEAIVIN